MVSCFMCQASGFANNRALNSHLARCKNFDAFTQETVELKKRARNAERASAKIARRAGIQDIEREREDLREQRIEQSLPDESRTNVPASTATEVPMNLPENTPPEEPVSVSRSGRIHRMPRALVDYLPSTSAGLPSHIRRRRVPQPVQHVPEESQSAAEVRVVQESSDAQHPDTSATEATSAPAEIACTLEYHETDPDAFGVFKQYAIRPRVDPEESTSLNDLVDSPNLRPPDASMSMGARIRRAVGDLARAVTESITENTYYPFPNPTAYMLTHWAHTGSNIKSDSEMDRLAAEVIGHPDFDVADARTFRIAKEHARIDQLDRTGGAFADSDGWHEASVQIRVPKEKAQFDSEDNAPIFKVSGIHFKKLTSVIRAICQDTSAGKYQWRPFKMFWRREKAREDASDQCPEPEVDDERIYSELYNSDAMLEEDAKIRSLPRTASDPEDTEAVMIPLMLWSDSTHLASFGCASLWPIYLFPGFVSKYVRGKPSEHAAEHIAYMPKLDDTIQDFYQDTYGTTAAADILRFCKRELVHAIWLLLLDADFMQAYEHGILILCGDMIWRRVYPRFFTYSADYPEKILLACIRYLAECPCPRCYIKKGQISRLGTQIDAQRRSHVRKDDSFIQRTIKLARAWLFEGYGPKSRAIARMLDDKSLVPTQSAFSARLSQFGFDHYSMFVPDLMHEFELGVWKAVLTHLIRILYAHGQDRIQYFNKRFRKVPTFGRDTIRCFHENVSGLKKLAARDFEDILQCIMPVMEALLDDGDNEIIANLVFELANWHALAKLRLHTEETLKLLTSATRTLGRALRVFQSETCERYDTRELPKEEAARGRREAAYKANIRGGNTKGKGAKKKGKSDKMPDAGKSAKRKTLNLSTYKLHALGDYVDCIRRYGPTDGYSTQPGELTHRIVKRFYARTNKNGFAHQIAVRQRRQQILQRIQKKVDKARAEQEAEQYRLQAGGREGERGHGASASSKRARKSKTNRSKTSSQGPRSGAALRFTAEEILPYSLPQDRYHISTEQRYHVDIFQWLRENENDPACLHFVPHLKDHLLARFLGRTYDGDENEFSPEERQLLRFESNRMYFHKVLRVNYTTYDMRRSQDSINPRTHADIMLLAHEDSDDDDAETHPFWYARVIGVFHVNVLYKGERKLMHFLWVRWLGRDLEERGGFETRRLHRVGFVGGEDPNAFGFVDPAHVVRGAHLIPAFAHGRTEDFLGPSIARQPREQNRDYIYYYVNMFVDRDMYMRYRGGGVGHKGSVVEIGDGGDSGWVSDDDLEEEEVDGSDSEERGVGGAAQLGAGDDEDVDLQDEATIGNEEDDFGYRDSESEGGSDDEEDGAGADTLNESDGEEGQLGPEDGEDEYGEDIYDVEGFAPL